MIQNVIDDMLITRFANNIDLHEYIKKMEHENGRDYYQHIQHSNSGNGVQWYGASYDGAMTRLLYGNKEYTERFIDGLKELNQDIDVNINIFRDIEGFAYDMGAVVDGEPECCLNIGSPKEKPTIKIRVGYSFAGSVDSDVLRNRGVAITNLIYTLMVKGYIIDLAIAEVFVPCYRFDSPDSSKRLDKSAIYINIPTENLCIGTVAMYNSVEFFRVLMILTHSMLCDKPQRPGDGKGTMEESDIKQAFGDDCFFIPAGFYDGKMMKLNTVEKANEYITQLFNEYCNKQNINIGD